MNELELKIKCIVKDALHLLNNKNVTNYNEGEICDYIYYYIEQYRECSDDMIENLLNQVDVILCTEEDGFDADDDEASLVRLSVNWMDIEQSLKADIIYREVIKDLTEKEFEDLTRQTVLKTAVGRKLNKQEEYIHIYLKCNDECGFTDNELERIREVSIRRNYGECTEKEKRELKEEIKGLSFKEAEYYLLNKAGRIPEIDLWIKEE